MNKLIGSAWIFGAAVAWALLYYTVDEPLALWISSTRAPWLIRTARMISLPLSPFLNLCFWPFVLMIERLFFRKKELFWFFLAMALSVIIAMLITGNIKMVLGRARPYLFTGEFVSGFYGFTTREGYLSAPSSHASVAAALLFTAQRWQYLSPLWMLVIGSTLLSRIVLLEHFPSDLVLGLGVGYISYQIVKIGFRRFIPKEREEIMKIEKASRK